MIRKLLFYMIFLAALNGCGQNIAFLGPAVSYTHSGNVNQSALSYGSNQLLKKMKIRPIVENKGNAFDNNISINDNEFEKLVKRNFEKTRKKLKLLSQ